MPRVPLGRATLRLDGDQLLTVHSAHLYPHNNPVSAAIRERQIAEMLKAMESDMGTNKKMILMGDLKLQPDSPEYAQWMSAGFLDSFATAGEGNGFTIQVLLENSF